MKRVLQRPMFLAVQIFSIAVILFIMVWLWFLIFAFPPILRAPIYQLFIETGVLGPNAIFLVYSIISLMVAQQIFKAFLTAPISSEVEPADIYLLFPAPIQAHTFFIAKYVRSIPRRLLLFFYSILAFSPIIAFLGDQFNLSLGIIILLIALLVLLGEIGALSSHILYFLRRFFAQPRRHQRALRSFFYIIVGLGIFLLLAPLLPLPTFSLATLLVALGTNGQFAPLPPFAFLLTTICLITFYECILVVAILLCNRIAIDLYDDITTIAHRRGPPTGLLSRLPIAFHEASSPFRALVKKDFITGLRSPGKAFYWGGIITNYILAIIFLILLPAVGILLPLPETFSPLTPLLYTIVLLLVVPLLALTTVEPFRGEAGISYLVRSAPLTPRNITFIKFTFALATPALMLPPFAIYFAVIFNDVNLLGIGFTILPHAVILSTAMGIGLGSRYPFALHAKKLTPVALIITHPFLSWVLMTPVVFFLMESIRLGIPLLLSGVFLMIPYTAGMTLMLLMWASRSYRLQE